jgi:exonuclease III
LNISQEKDYKTRRKIKEITKEEEDIIFLCDIRLNTDDEKKKNSAKIKTIEDTFEEKGYAFYHNSKTNKRGVGMLVKKNLSDSPPKKEDFYKDDECNILLLKITIAGCKATIGSVYGPGKKSYETFYDNIESNEKNFFHNTHVVIGGDWNASLDIWPASYNHKNENKERSQRLRRLCANLKIADPFRRLHPEKRELTFVENGSEEKSRIDFFLVSYPLLRLVGLSCLIKHDTNMRLFDHRAVKLYL